MARARRSYVRDSRGRFASTPGGPARAASGLPKRQARKMGTPPPRRRGLVAQRAAVRRSAAKLKGLDASGSYSGAMKQRGQRAAVTRAANRLKAAEQSGRRRLRPGAQQGVIRPGKALRGGRAALPAGKPKPAKPAAKLLPGARFMVNKYGLKDAEANWLIQNPKSAKRVIDANEAWREKNGLPSPGSPLSRGHLLEQIKAAQASGAPGFTKKLPTALKRIRMPRSAGTLAKPKVAGAKGGKALRGGKKALPEEKVAKPAVRGKGRIRMARPANTVAKPKGLKPGALAERRAAKAARLSPARPTQRKSRRPTFAAIERASANYKRAIIGAAVDGGRSFTEAQRLMRIKGRTPQEESALRAASAAHRKGSRAVATAGAALEYYGIKVGSKEYTRMTRVTKKSVADAKRVDRASRPRRPS